MSDMRALGETCVLSNSCVATPVYVCAGEEGGVCGACGVCVLEEGGKGGGMEVWV